MLIEALTSIGLASFLGDTIKSFAGDEIKAKLTNRFDPAQTAKANAFNLFQNLERLQFTLDQLIDALKALVDAAEASRGEIHEAETLARVSDVHSALKAVLDTIRWVDADIIRMKGRLDVYQPDLVKIITKVGFDRAQPLGLADPVEEFLNSDDVRREYMELIKDRGGKLRDRLALAQGNSSDVKRVAEEFRTFLATQFSFKDSF